jgi:phage terminase large subunit
LVQTAQIKLPTKIAKLFDAPRGAVQYRCSRGGRGSGKSYNFALMAAVWGYTETLRVLCGRDLQNSIKESFHAELKNAIASYPWLENAYDVGVDYIRGKNGTEFLFKGLRHNTKSIKSLAQIDLTIIEEAEDVAEESWLDLEATVFRQPKSELWALWNPRRKLSPVDKRFVQSPPDNCLIETVNYYDNPYFPTGLETLRLRQRELLDDATYRHIWEGSYLENSNAQVFNGKYEIREFTPTSEWQGAYVGIDFGFSQDPSTAVKCWVHGDYLYIEHEAYKIGLELDDTADYFKSKIPQIENYTARADNARPESISYLKRHGLSRITGVKKWAGSVEDGIQFMRSFKAIVLHPRCTNAIEEFRSYSYKVDRLTGDVLPDLVDSNNHIVDAIRYAVEPIIKNRYQNMKAMNIQFSI